MTCSPKLATLLFLFLEEEDVASGLTDATVSAQTLNIFMEKNKKSINKALTAELNVMLVGQSSKTNLASHVKQCAQ